MKIKGLYGEEFSASEWAERLEVEVDLIFLCLQAGKSIADIHVLLKKPYEPPKTRKPRESAQMLQTKERMAILLEVSGVADRSEAMGALTVQRLGNNGWHRVLFEGLVLGNYNYRNGSLRLSGGQGLPLWSLEQENAKVTQDADGLWQPHPDTQKHIVQQAIKTKDIDDELREIFAIHKRAEEARKATQ